MEFYAKITSKPRQKTETIVKSSDQTSHDKKTGCNKFSPRNSLRSTKINKELPDYSYLNMFGSVNLP
ncbi:hypothetical protein LOAG_17506 [Loa loa]|uniref:Uncharacterized protein n=1 Tax=Loa loa TaxID=7209 RepID=A0A1S0UIQ3_LOALO|nr:hypothetical protein LOAG_17506 [Loa loa]EJD75331.1 hypothetical protein LOAG_17506 [Loa loa]